MNKLTAFGLEQVFKILEDESFFRCELPEGKLIDFENCEDYIIFAPFIMKAELLLCRNRGG